MTTKTKKPKTKKPKTSPLSPNAQRILAGFLIGPYEVTYGNRASEELEALITDPKVKQEWDNDAIRHPYGELLEMLGMNTRDDDTEED